MTTQMIQKKNVGAPMDFLSSDGVTLINGRIESVRNRVATVRYWVVGDLICPNDEGFTAYIPVRDKRIVAVYSTPEQLGL